MCLVQNLYIGTSLQVPCALLHLAALTGDLMCCLLTDAYDCHAIAF